VTKFHKIKNFSKSPPEGKIIETYEDIESSDIDEDLLVTKMNKNLA